MQSMYINILLDCLIWHKLAFSLLKRGNSPLTCFCRLSALPLPSKGGSLDSLKVAVHLSVSARRCHSEDKGRKGFIENGKQSWCNGLKDLAFLLRFTVFYELSCICMNIYTFLFYLTIETQVDHPPLAFSNRKLHSCILQQNISCPQYVRIVLWNFDASMQRGKISTPE